MLRVALTGGIASGKTSVSEALAQRGAVVIDADVLAREVVEPGTPGLSSIVERFGSSVLRHGALDRAALGAIVFADSVARRDLERIVHPAVRKRADELERTAAADAIVVHVIPLLVETGQQGTFDVCLVVDVDPGVQLERLMVRSGLSTEDAQARIDAQASREQRLAVADILVDNSGTPEELQQRVDAVWTALKVSKAGT